MNSKERFDFMSANLPGVYKATAEDIITSLVDDLIGYLYIPLKGERNRRVDKDRLKLFEINEREPINWEDLKCNEVKEFTDGSFLVIIDEASPGDCPAFCEYIKTYLKSYGWIAEVQTEW